MNPLSLLNLLLVAAGGAIGSAARYALSAFVLRVSGSLFPFGTFAVNLLGCIVFGLIAGAADQRVPLASAPRAFLLVGVLGGFLLGTPSIVATVAAVLLLTLSSVLDCCDGELARIRFSESKLGHLLDITGDTLVHLGLFAGIARRLAATGVTPDTPVLIALGLGILGAFAVITWSEATETRRIQVDCWENRVLANVLSPLTTRDWYVFPMAFAVAGRLDALVPAAAIGAHGFWIVTLIVLRRVLRRL